MLRNALPCLLLSLVSATALALDTTSRIDAVTLYPSGATVTRVASIDLPAGTSTVRLTGLVNGLDPNRLRIDVDGSGVELGQVRFSREQQREAFNVEIERLNREIREAEAGMSGIDDAVKSAELRLKFLEGLAQGYAKEAWHGGARGTADVNSWHQALALLESASTDAYAEIRQLKAGRPDAERDLSLLQRELGELRGSALASSVLEVSLRAARSMTTTLRLHYFQDNARWEPQYEARLDSEARSLRLIQQAVVLQGTDEPWTDVELSLSTSDPSGDLEPGTMGSEFLDLRDPVRRAPELDYNRLSADEVAEGVEEIAVTGARVSARVGTVAVTYEVPGRVSVANTADESQAFDINATSADVELVTRIIPRRNEQAFLAARFVYDGNVPLYASTMRVYVDGAYAGITEMPTALPQTEVTLPMGADRRVEVDVVDQGELRGKEGIVSRKRTETTSYLFEIANRRQSETIVEVLDRYPVARNDDIHVEVPRDAAGPDVTNLDDQPGVILWRKSLSPNETWRIAHAYTVTYPADKTLQRR